MRPILTEKRYLGDGVYVTSASYGISIWLTTENGIEVTNRIMLEPEVEKSLQKYLNELKEGVKAHFDAMEHITRESIKDA